MEAGISLLQRVLRWSGRVGLGRKATVVLAIAALASGVATYAAMTGAPPFGPNGGNVLLLLNIDLVLLLLLADYCDAWLAAAHGRFLNIREERR